MRFDKGKEVSWFSLKRVTSNGGEECHRECPFLSLTVMSGAVCRLFGDLSVEIASTANKNLPVDEWMGIRRHGACKDCQPVKPGIYQKVFQPNVEKK